MHYFKVRQCHATGGPKILSIIFKFNNVAAEILKSASFHLGSYTLRTDIKGRKSNIKKCHAAGRTIAQLRAAVGQRKVTYCFVTFLSICPTISTEIARNVFSDHAVINLKRKIQIFRFKMLVLGNIQEKIQNK